MRRMADTVDIGSHTTGTETGMADEEGAEQGELAITRTGDKLRLAREAAGLSLADVATRTRITQRHLEAIEKSDFRSEEHTSELKSLMRISYAVFCLNKKKTTPITPKYTNYSIHH